MLTLIILFFLLISFYTGYRRGTAYQLFFTIGYAISFILALFFYKGLGERLDLFVPYPSVTSESTMVFYTVEQGFELDKAFYAGVAFMSIILIGWLITHLIAVFFKNLLFRVLFAKYDGLIAGAISVFLSYMLIFLLLKLASFIPLALVQNALDGSGLAIFIVEHSLFLSPAFETLWVSRIIG
ncbi:colicin V production protein CvpA [Enterococcus florum]|uniref:Colicin V production protein CvpA n=1 Tax=Enterococcus florum TaxID=2480627 RepID=A0A4V0WP12_9ENTE|nr:CvpA family protein [Enterococcus florum]GCF92249.1 colicin V production protein CvpA [Enterococcus florum]